MRTANLVALTLLMSSPLACSEDAPTRPEDGTVELWDECLWDGQFIRALCEPDLECAWNGICVPRCDAMDLCTFEGFTSICGFDAGENVCKVQCDDDRKCPETGGAPLHCRDFFCVREP